MTTRLSPLAQSILQTIRHPRAGNVGEIVKRNRAALNALSIEERTAVMREVDAAAGFDLFPEEQKEYLPRRRYETMIDEILGEAPKWTDKKNWLETLPTLRGTEKFFFEEEAAIAIRDMDFDLIADLIPQFARFPYSHCWFEFPDMALLIEASDDTFQRGNIRVFFENKKFDCLSFTVGTTILFDFTEDFEGFETERNRRIYGQAIGETDASPTSPGRNFKEVSLSQEKIGFRFNHLTYKQFEKESIEQFLYWVERGFFFKVLSVMLLNFPKHIVEITKDDFADFNKKRRRLGQRKKQRQEFHHVRITGTKTELTDEAARIMAERRAQYEPKGGTHASPGQHNVRGFRRVSKYSRVTWVKPHSRGKGPCKTIRQGYKTETAVDRDIIARIVQEMADLQETP
jgi:hypothetical protein